MSAIFTATFCLVYTIFVDVRCQTA